MKRNHLAISVVIAIVAVMGAGIWYVGNSAIAASKPCGDIILSIPTSGIPALIYIAEDQGYFKRNGLNVTLREYNAGADAFSGMLKGEADIGLTAEYPVVTEAFKKDNLSILANIDKYQVIYLVYQNDTGIHGFKDLAGKKIGVQRGSLCEFYLGRYLNMHGMSMDNSTLVDLPMSQLPDALASGSIDACVVRDVEVLKIRDLLGDNLTTCKVQSYQSSYALLACDSDWAAAHPEEIDRLLMSLLDAEQYAINHPAEARKIVQRRNNYTADFMAVTWPEHQYSLSLDHSLIIAMEDEGRWMIASNLTPATKIPDYRNYIYTRGMEKVKPEAINII